MNAEERIAETFLKALGIGEITYEPNGNMPPDFSVGNNIGVEVRRLNQHFFNNDNKPVGLENLEISIWDVFIDVLRSFDKSHQGESYWVGIDFQRPILNSMKELKAQMKNALVSFLREKPKLPYEVQVIEQVSFYIFQSEPEDGELFREASSSDTDAGGFVISLYIENINHCIKEKNLKINPVISNYPKWWLLLVDTMSWGLDTREVLEVLKSVTELGSFEKIFVINREGKLLMNR